MSSRLCASWPTRSVYTITFLTLSPCIGTCTCLSLGSSGEAAGKVFPSFQSSRHAFSTSEILQASIRCPKYNSNVCLCCRHCGSQLTKLKLTPVPPRQHQLSLAAGRDTSQGCKFQATSTSQTWLTSVQVFKTFLNSRLPENTELM